MPSVYLLAFVFLCAHASFAAAVEVYKDDAVRIFLHNDRNIRAIGRADPPAGCLYEGRWFTSGSAVPAREACLRCVCAGGALRCARRACAPLPDPPPPRCHVLHRKHSCCPELHCPDGVKLMEREASARSDFDDYSDYSSTSIGGNAYPACVFGGAVYAAGSALESSTACEQCFCLGAARRCVRPRCLPPPPGCRARPAPGACCPARYYCDRRATAPPEKNHLHDCEVNGHWISEGERVVSMETSGNCTQCFCLRGSVRCQPLACAQPLLGCIPLTRPGQCCPHQYQCHHGNKDFNGPKFIPLTSNNLIAVKSEDRAMHSSKTIKSETTPKSASTTSKISTPSVISIKNEPIPTVKVKRKTSDQPPPSISTTMGSSTTLTTPIVTKSLSTSTKHTSQADEYTTTDSEDNSTTDQPDESVKIVINGTINCTSEISTSLPFNVSFYDSENMQEFIKDHVSDTTSTSTEAQTFNPNDIITEKSYNGGFDENDMFIINVTSSLRANTSQPTPVPAATTVSAKASISDLLAEDVNFTNKSKEDYDFDYTEPTLPPSLPNLKIIPFVAADAVVEDDPAVKEPLTYPILEREDKYPIYYPSIEKKPPFANRREDVYNPNQYPVYTSDKKEPSIMNEASNPGYSVDDDLSRIHEYTVSASLGNRIPYVNKVATKRPLTTSTFAVETPAVNLFSPPMETEGGFIPKGPEIIDEYYAVFPSTVGPALPHLTTSMQLDTPEGNCISTDGRLVSEGETISVACSVCSCSWAELHCAPRRCQTPPHCSRSRVSSSSGDICCGDLICNNVNKTTSVIAATNSAQIHKFNITTTEIDLTTQKSEGPKEPVPDTVTTVEREDIINLTSNFKHETILQENADLENANKTTVNETTVKNKTEIMTTKAPEITLTSTTVTTTTIKEIQENINKNETYTQSQEYEDEEEDEGFSFGSVLQLLLSDNYESSTKPSTKKKPTITTTTTSTTTTFRPKTSTSTTSRPVFTKKLPPKATLAPFIPMPQKYPPYIPPKRILQPSTIDRIDHLVLGEATAIKRPTPKPSSSNYGPVSTSTTRSPLPFITSTSSPAIVDRTEQSGYASVAHEGPRPPGTPGLTAADPLGLLKLAGCNIYGRMYRVGKIIAELSTPCLECRCTELGVQCRPLNC